MQLFRNMDEAESTDVTKHPQYTNLSEQDQKKVQEIYQGVYVGNQRLGIKLAQGLAYEAAKRVISELFTISKVGHSAGNFGIAKAPNTHKFHAMARSGDGANGREQWKAISHGFDDKADAASHLKTKHGVDVKENQLIEAEIDWNGAESYVGFDKMKEKLSGQKGVYDPAGLAASIGRENGKKRFQHAADQHSKLGEAEGTSGATYECYSVVPVNEDGSLVEAEDEQSCYAITKRPKGTWRWQDRHALVHYKSHTTKDGRRVWKHYRTIDDKVKPGLVRDLQANGWHGQPVTYGGLHHKPITEDDAAVIQKDNRDKKFCDACDRVHPVYEPCPDGGVHSQADIMGAAEILRKNHHDMGMDDTDPAKDLPPDVDKQIHSDDDKKRGDEQAKEVPGGSGAILKQNHATKGMPETDSQTVRKSVKEDSGVDPIVAAASKYLDYRASCAGTGRCILEGTEAEKAKLPEPKDDQDTPSPDELDATKDKPETDKSDKKVLDEIGEEELGEGIKMSRQHDTSGSAQRHLQSLLQRGRQAWAKRTPDGAFHVFWMQESAPVTFDQVLEQFISELAAEDDNLDNTYHN